jgi:hypothetical protein
MVRNWLSEYGLSSETCGRLCVLVTPKSASKKATGLELAMRESAELAKRLIEQSCAKQNIRPGQLTLHADRGTSTYLGGGRDFGPVGSVPHLYSRNLTPDKTRLPEGGRTYEQFVEIMRHGTDLDHVHPSCTAPGVPTNCFEPPFNGDLLQVMRWPSFSHMTDHELRAIYEYLKAVPCNPGQVIAGAPYLQNACE